MPMSSTPPHPRPAADPSTRDTAADRRGSAYRHVQELAGIATWSSESVTGRFRTNAAARAILEWPDDRPPPSGEDLMAVVHPEDRGMVAELMARTRATGVGYMVDHRLLLPGNRVRHMHAVVCADLDDAGQVVAVHGVTLDVTALQLARQEAEAQRNLSRWILSSLTEGYLLLRDQEIVEVNDAFCQIVGYPAAELVGTRPPRPFWPAAQSDDLVAARAGHGTGELTFVHRAGHPLRVAVTATAMTDADGAALWLVLVRDVTEDRAREDRLRATAANDALTGIPNSGTFRRALREQVDLHAQNGVPLTLALIDIDHFKQVNDEHGHAVGDEVLIAVVHRLRAVTSKAGELYRVGGEELALLLPGADSSGARELLETALAALRATPLPHGRTVTASAGVAQLATGMDDDALFRIADRQLYEAKARGRDQVRG